MWCTNKTNMNDADSSFSNRILHCQDHASVQIAFAEVLDSSTLIPLSSMSHTHYPAPAKNLENRTPLDY